MAVSVLQEGVGEQRGQHRDENDGSCPSRAVRPDDGETDRNGYACDPKGKNKKGLCDNKNRASCDFTLMSLVSFVSSHAGERQANLTGYRLRQMYPEYDVIIHSSLERAVQTAGHLHRHLPMLSMVQDDFIREGGPIPPNPPISYWNLPDRVRFKILRSSWSQWNVEFKLRVERVRFWIAVYLTFIAKSACSLNLQDVLRGRSQDRSCISKAFLQGGQSSSEENKANTCRARKYFPVFYSQVCIVATMFALITCRKSLHVVQKRTGKKSENS